MFVYEISFQLSVKGLVLCSAVQCSAVKVKETQVTVLFSAVQLCALLVHYTALKYTTKQQVSALHCSVV